MCTESKRSYKNIEYDPHSGYPKSAIIPDIIKKCHTWCWKATTEWVILLRL